MPYPTIPEGAPVQGVPGGGGMPPYPGVGAYPDPNANSTPYPLAPPGGSAQGEKIHWIICYFCVMNKSDLPLGPTVNTGGGAVAPGGWNF